MKTLDTPLLELQEIELFLASFRQNLLSTGSAEAAFLTSVALHNYRLPIIFQKVADKLQLGKITMFDLLVELEQYFQNSENGRIFSSLRRILTQSIEGSIKQIQRFQFQIQRQRILLNKRNNIQKAVRFKARILLGLTSFLIGFITSISPLFEILASLSTTTFSSSLLSEITKDPSPLAILLPLSLFLLIQVRANYHIGEDHRIKTIILSIILYTFGFMIAQNMFNFTFYFN